MIIGLRRIKLKVKKKFRRRKNIAPNTNIKEITSFSEKITEIEFNEIDEEDEFDKYDSYMDEKVILGKLQQYQEVRIVRDQADKVNTKEPVILHVKETDNEPISKPLKRLAPNMNVLKNIKNISDSNLPFKKINNKINEAKNNKVKVTNLDELHGDICEYRIKFYYLRKVIIAYLIVVLISSLVNLWVKAP